LKWAWCDRITNSSQIGEETTEASGIKGFALKPLAKKGIGELVRKILDGKNPFSTLLLR